jgi:hypothetical protein
MDKGKEYILAIDPDVSGCGVCFLRNGEFDRLENMELWEVFDFIHECSTTFLFSKFIVLVEKSQGKNTSWVGGGKGSARDVGRNQEIGNQILRYCLLKKIPSRAITPKGYSSVKHESFLSITKSDFKRTNAETRVAGLIAYNAYRGLV